MGYRYRSSPEGNGVSPREIRVAWDEAEPLVIPRFELPRRICAGERDDKPCGTILRQSNGGTLCNACERRAAKLELLYEEMRARRDDPKLSAASAGVNVRRAKAVA